MNIYEELPIEIQKVNPSVLKLRTLLHQILYRTLYKYKLIKEDIVLFILEELIRCRLKLKGKPTGHYIQFIHSRLKDYLRTLRTKKNSLQFVDNSTISYCYTLDDLSYIELSTHLKPKIKTLPVSESMKENCLTFVTETMLGQTSSLSHQKRFVCKQTLSKYLTIEDIR